MSVDEVKQGDRLRGLLETAQRSVTEFRRGAETIEPIPQPGRRALVQRARERLAWTRLPGLRAADAAPRSYTAILIQRFSLFVLLPTAVIAFYLFAIASDQFVAEAQFAVRGNVEPMENAMLGDYTSLIQKHNSQDSYIVRDYINSQSMVEAVDKSLGVSRMFSRREADFWARYSHPQPIEELTKYWREHVQARIDAISGVIQLSVRAFTPEDALTIVKDVVARSETLINDISQRAQADMVVQSQKDAVVAQDRLRKATLEIQRYRNHWGIIDPIKSAEATLIAIAALRKDKFKAENDLQVLRGSNLDEKSRSIQVLVASVAALDHQIKTLQEQLTNDGSASGGAPTMSNALLEYEGLMVERTIAEKLNELATGMLDKARVSASKQHIFLATFVPPALPTDSLYPRRAHQLFVAFFCFLVLWSSVSLVLGGINDQRL